jgi:hypothetical protein
LIMGEYLEELLEIRSQEREEPESVDDATEL